MTRPVVSTMVVTSGAEVSAGSRLSRAEARVRNALRLLAHSEMTCGRLGVYVGRREVNAGQSMLA